MQATRKYEVERRTRILGSDVRAGAAYEFSKATGASERGPTPLPPGRGKCLFKGIRSLELKRSQTAPSRRGHKGKVGARAVLDARHQHVEPESQLRLVAMESVEPSSPKKDTNSGHLRRGHRGAGPGVAPGLAVPDRRARVREPLRRRPRSGVGLATSYFRNVSQEKSPEAIGNLRS